jgi:hypothetical protein
MPDETVTTRSACVIAGSAPGDVAAVGRHAEIALRENRLGTLVTGRPGQLVIDYAAELAGPVYDIMYNPRTGWFAVTIYRGLGSPVRWDNRPGTNPGYPRVADVCGATTPMTILDALDVPATAIGYSEA